MTRYCILDRDYLVIKQDREKTINGWFGNRMLKYHNENKICKENDNWNVTLCLMGIIKLIFIKFIQFWLK